MDKKAAMLINPKKSRYKWDKTKNKLVKKCLLDKVIIKERVKNMVDASYGSVMENLEWSLEKQLTHAIPIIAEELKGKLEKVGLQPPHNYEPYIDEVGHRERKHILHNCKGCQWDEFFERYGMK